MNDPDPTPAPDPAPSPSPSLIPEPSEVPEPTPKPDPTPSDWKWADGVTGSGDKPDWYKSDKYETVEAQARAYTDLEKRFGSFTGAPKDGKYEFSAPDGVEFDAEHPLATAFTDWAGENQLGQKGYNELLGMLAQYEASQVPDMAEIKKDLGTNADARIQAIAQWGKANLPVSGYNLLRSVTSGQHAAEAFKLVEALIAQAQEPQLPGPGDDVLTGAAELEAIQAEHHKKNDKGKALYFVDPEHRKKVDKMYEDYYARQSGGR